MARYPSVRVRPWIRVQDLVHHWIYLADIGIFTFWLFKAWSFISITPSWYFHKCSNGAFWPVLVRKIWVKQKKKINRRVFYFARVKMSLLSSKLWYWTSKVYKNEFVFSKMHTNVNIFYITCTLCFLFIFTGAERKHMKCVLIWAE